MSTVKVGIPSIVLAKSKLLFSSEFGNFRNPNIEKFNSRDVFLCRIQW